jgi:hypothetical protein
MSRTLKKKTWSAKGTSTKNGTMGSGARRTTHVPKDTPSAVAESTAVKVRPALRLSKMRIHSKAQKSISAENW